MEVELLCLYTPCHKSLALHAKSQRNGRTCRSKCTQPWLANGHFCEWTSSALWMQSTRSVRAVVLKNLGKYYRFSTIIWLELHIYRCHVFIARKTTHAEKISWQICDRKSRDTIIHPSHIRQDGYHIWFSHSISLEIAEFTEEVIT